MNKVKRFFGWLFLTRNYLAALSDEQVAVRALGPRGAYIFEQGRRDVANANEALCRIAARWRTEVIKRKESQ